MRVGTGGGVARVTVAENITALWTFAHANGISLDDIIERTSGAGVTIDGVQLVDAEIRMLNKASSNDPFLRVNVSGDVANRV